MRSKYGDRWRREKSSMLTEKTRIDADKYTTILSKAATSDQQVIQKFSEIRDGLAMLCKPQAELLALLPSQRPASAAGMIEKSARFPSPVMFFVLLCLFLFSFLVHMKKCACSHAPSSSSASTLRCRESRRSGPPRST